MQYFNLHTFFFSIMSLSAYLHHDIELRDVATKTDDVMWCDVWGGEGRLPLHLQIPKNTLAGRSEKLHWQTCDPLLSPYISRLLATEDHAQNLEEQLWTGVHQLMGSCFEWRGGREGVLYLTDVVNSCDLKWERPVFRRSVSTFLHLVEAFTYHLTKTQLGNIHSCSAQRLVLHLFHGF